MTYKAEITFHIGTERELTYEREFSRLEDTVSWLNHKLEGMSMATVYINNKRIAAYNGQLLGDDGEPFCINQVWHDLFAKESYPRIEVAK